MGPLPRRLLLGVCAVLILATVLANASPEDGKAAPMVVGLATCADCTRKNMKAEAAFKGLQVAVKCKKTDGVYETKAVGEVDKSGAFAVPLDAGLLRDDGELKQDCFAQLHSAPSKPCPGQEPSWIARPSNDAAGKTTFVAVAGKMHYSSKECASAFLCDPFHKKHLFHKKPIMIPPFHKKPIEIPHFHKKSIAIPHFHKKPVPVPEYKPPTPVYKPPTPVPEYKPPTPVYTHPTPIYHPPADQKAQNPETDTQLFKKVLAHFHKKPIAIPHFHKKPVPVPEYKPPTPVPEYKPPTPVYTHPSPTPIYHPPADQKAQNPETDPQLFKKLLPFIKKNPFLSKFPKYPPVKEETKP